MTPRTPARLALLAIVAAAAAAGGCEEVRPLGQIVLYIDTDAIVAEPLGTTPDPTALSPLVDRARLEVLNNGAAQPGGTRDFVIDAAMLRAGRVSFGILPRQEDPSFTARILLFRADRVTGSAPEAGVALETIVALPRVASEGVAEYSVTLHADDFGASIGPIAPTAGRPGASLVNTWRGGHRVPCEGAARPGETCVPGGAFFFGVPQFRGRSPLTDIYAERLVVISPFFLDATEVTVGDLRNTMPALSAKQVPPPKELTPRVDKQPPVASNFCTWTAAPIDADHEAVVVNCVSWATARGYCLELGKDLPSEAAFEYATTGLGEEWAFPWGNEEPDCRGAVWGRGGIDPFGEAPHQCRQVGSYGGPTFPRSQAGDTVDSNVLRSAGGTPIVDLGGNLSEWMVDLWGRPTDAFWSTTRMMVDPVDQQISAADGDARVARGGNWSTSALTARGGLRVKRVAAPEPPDSPTTGFRCARKGGGRGS